MTWRWWADFFQYGAIVYGLLLLGVSLGLFVVTPEALFFVVVILVMLNLFCLSMTTRKEE